MISSLDIHSTQDHFRRILLLEAIQMIEAGADRLGTSSGVAIVAK